MSKAPACIGPHPNPRRPRHPLPAGASDCHCHVFEDPAKYPLVENRSYTPPYLPLARYLGMCETVGLSRTVQVNASVYGFDNSLTLDIIAELGQHRARGVAGVRPDVTAAELARLKKQVQDDDAFANELPPDGGDREPLRRDAAPSPPGA